GTSTSGSDYRNPVVGFTDPIGAMLPALSNDYLPAYAWRPDFYLETLVGAGAGWTTPTGLGDGLLIGSAIDFYMVAGGSIGDTVTIESATYVLSGPLPFGTTTALSNTKQTIAVLVE